MPENVLLSIEGSRGNILYSNVMDLPNNFSNASTVVSKSPLALDSLTLVTAINYDALYKEFGASRIILITFTLVCSLIFIVISFVLSESLTRPISFLSRLMARHASDGRTSNCRYFKRTDEIGILFNEYNSMLQELDSHIKREYQNKLITLDSQMKSLEAQINSHFLYNTLESINSMAEIEGIESISVMSMALGNMFRYSIKTKSELVTMAEELNHVKDYVSIQQIRFSNRFHVDLEVPEALLSKKVLKLILQPIVENALYHGLHSCRFGDAIRICAQLNDRILSISVSDNGCGMTKEQLNSLCDSLAEPARFTELGQRNKQSIGLKNIHSRIELYYGQGYGLSIKSQEGRGTEVTIRLPVLQEEASHV